MKVVILAGGLGTRISEETTIKPKPMVEIGGMPILWHIMKIYSSYGFNEFIICLGYKGYFVKEFFKNYSLHKSDLTIDLKSGSINILKNNTEPWKVTLVDTGLNSMTGGRIKRIHEHIGDETFLLTYGDGVSDVDVESLVSFHKSHGALCTVTTVQPAGRFGAIEFGDNDRVSSFLEKPRGDGSWINGGFFVCEPEVFSYIEGDHTVFEQEPMTSLAKDGQMVGYRHHGFWKPMDTLRDKIELEKFWSDNNAKWKKW